MAADLGMASVQSWARVNKWAESNRAGSNLLKKRVVKDDETLRQLHVRMAENYDRLGQHTNAVKSYTAARKIRDDQLVHFRLMEQLDRGKASSSAISTIVKEYAEKYTKRDDRFRGLSWLAQACLLYTSPSPRDATLSRMPSSA